MDSFAPLTAMGRRPGPATEPIDSFALGHKPYLSPRLLNSSASDSYLPPAFPASHSVDFFADIHPDPFIAVRQDDLQSFAFPESSQRTLLPETPFGMYDSISSDSLASRFAMQDWPEGPESEPSPRDMLHFHRSSFVSESDRSCDTARKQQPSDLLVSLYEDYFTPEKFRQMTSMFSVDASVPQRSTPVATHATSRSPQMPPVFLTLQLNRESLEEIQDPEDQSVEARIFNFAEDSDEDEDEEDYFDRTNSWMRSNAPDDSRYLDTDLSSLGSDQNLDRHWSHSSLTLVGSSMGADSDQSLKDDSMSPGPSQFDPESPISNSTPGRSFSGSSLPALTSTSSGTQKKTPTKKKSKMHQCGVCQKWFPRPSGLKTHMNSHSGEKPYKCTVPNCNKSFAVRSNAKRHLRTHGIIPTSEPSTRPASKFTVGFETPMIASSSAHEMAKIPPKLKWIPQSLQKCTNISVIQRESSVEDGDSSDDMLSPSPSPILPVPLPAVVPSLSRWNFDDDYEERNSFNAEIGTYPYHPSQWRGLPGPAPIPPTGVH